MLIDLSALLRGETKEVPVDYRVTLTDAPDGIEYTAPAEVHGKVTDSGGYIRLESAADVPYRGECARCLDPVERVLHVSFVRTLIPEGTASEKQLSELEDEEDYLIIKRGVLDMDEALCEAIYLEFPYRLLCSEDCPGLCPVCGKKLKVGEVCTCHKPETDPRGDKLKKLLENEENGGEE